MLASFYVRNLATSPPLLRCRRCTVRGRVIRNLQPCHKPWFVVCYHCIRSGPESATRAGAVRLWSIDRLSRRLTHRRMESVIARDQALARAFDPSA